MAVYKSEAPPQESARGGELISLISRMAGRFVRFREAIRTRRSVGDLLKLDDRLLNDIGLTRGDVVAAISGSFVEDAGRRLSRFVRERQSADVAQSLRSAAERYSMGHQHR